MSLGAGNGCFDKDIVIERCQIRNAINQVSFREKIMKAKQKRSSNKCTRHIYLDTSKCQACWDCIDQCKFGTLGKLDVWFHKHVVVRNPENCTGCKVCITVCQNGVFSPVCDQTSEIKLGSVQKTMLLPLWGRAVETQKEKPLLVDEKALSIIYAIDYDFTLISKSIGKSIQRSWIARSIYFDNKIKAFLETHPDATIINIGCGLDTTSDRVDNGKVRWIDMDLPDAIDLRKKYITESNRRHFVSKSVLDKNWYDCITDKNHIMIMMAGVLYYFDQAEIIWLFNDFATYFPGAEIIFDYASPLGLSVSNKRVIENGGVATSARLKWSISDIRQIESWNPFIEVISSMPLFEAHKRHFPWIDRIGMIIADRLKMMSLAHVKINR